MSDRRQLTPGEGGDPRSEGTAARTAIPRARDRALAAGAPRDGLAACITTIGRAGRPGYLLP